MWANRSATAASSGGRAPWHARSAGAPPRAQPATPHLLNSGLLFASALDVPVVLRNADLSRVTDLSMDNVRPRFCPCCAGRKPRLRSRTGRQSPPAGSAGAGSSGPPQASLWHRLHPPAALVAAEVVSTALGGAAPWRSTSSPGFSDRFCSRQCVWG